MKKRIVILTKFNSHSSWLISHLLNRGINITGVVFLGTAKESKRVILARHLESLFLGFVHRIVAKSSPFTYSNYICQYNNILEELDKSKVPYCFVENHNSPEAENILKQWQPDVLLLYGTSIIKSHILKIPKIGTLNAHSALLPRYRGGKSEYWILKNKEPQYFGVTIHWVSSELDQGDIFLQEKIPVVKKDNPVSMRHKSVFIAAYLFSEALSRIDSGHIIKIPQDESIATKFKKPKPKKRILIFSPAYDPHLSGAEIAIQEITSRLEDQFEFDLICSRFERKLAKREKIKNVNVYRIGFGSSIDKYILTLAGFLKSLKLNRKKQYQLIHSSMATYGGLAALFFKLTHPKIPFLLTIQEDIFEGKIRKKTKFSPFLYNLIFKKADFIQVIANYMKERIEQRGFKAPIKVIPNGVDVKHFSREYSKEALQVLKNKLGIKEEEKVIITVSRLIEKKAVDDIIKAVTYLDFPFKLLILGKGKDLAKLKNLAKDLKIEDKVLFLGHIYHSELPQYLKISDVFVRPSLIEGLGNSFLEAMAVSLPIVATPIQGILDFLEDKETGLFCQKRNPKDIAQKINLLLSDNNLRQEIIVQARALIEQKYQWEIVAKEMQDLYELLIKL